MSVTEEITESVIVINICEGNLLLSQLKFEKYFRRDT